MSGKFVIVGLAAMGTACSHIGARLQAGAALLSVGARRILGIPHVGLFIKSAFNHSSRVQVLCFSLIAIVKISSVRAVAICVPVRFVNGGRLSCAFV
jgi:hypothetical protein